MKEHIKHDVGILIPARFNSSRFPGKPLAFIKNRPMIQHVYQNMLETGYSVYIVTDDDRIEEAVSNFGGKTIRINDKVQSGTDRIFLAYDRYLRSKGLEFIVNVQGDEPLLKAKDIINLVDFHRKAPFDITTLVKEQKGKQSLKLFEDSNIVKAIYSDTNHQCHYFSRSPIPNPVGIEEVENLKWYHHIGVYSYRTNALKKFVQVSSSTSYYENCEKLEQLRALSMGLTLGGHKCNSKLIGVDTPQDIKKVEDLIND